MQNTRLLSIYKQSEQDVFPINKKKFIGPLFCMIAAVLWGISFVAQKSGAYIGTFTFNGIRTFIGGLALIPVVAIFQFGKNKNLPKEQKKKIDLKAVVMSAVPCGVVLFVASTVQQHAFTFDIEAGKVAFITALYMILVPLAGIFLGKKIHANIWVAVVLGTVGLYFLCIKKGDFSVGYGELLSLICAFCFTAHIMCIDYYVKKVDTLPFACCQFLVSGSLGLIGMFIFEKPVWAEIVDQAIPLLYSGLCSCSIAYTCQIFGQKYSEPAVASLILCLESVFGAIAGWLILHDRLDSRAVFGCIVMFIGVILTQVEFKKKTVVN